MLKQFPQAALAATALMAALAGPAAATITGRDANAASPRGWSAVQGMDPSAVRDMARTLPVSRQAAVDQPWCAPDAEVEASLRHEFEEDRVASNGRDTALWGSAIMGTWTVVLERPDAVSCVIASGIGFSEGTSPDAYFTRVGLQR